MKGSGSHYSAVRSLWEFLSNDILRSNNIIELTLDELEKYSAYVSWIDVCKGWGTSE